MKILFIHEAPGQFRVLHKHLNVTGMAESWLMCAKSVFDREKKELPNLIPFTYPPDEEKTYFYVQKIEGRIKRSFHLRAAIIEFLKNHRLDLIVAHGSGGFPLHLFGEFDIPIITYIEFPSFGHHGQDSKYPQPEYARYVDKVFEMTSYHQVIRSDAVIVPSEYARGMFPEYLRHKIFAQMEGFEIARTKAGFEREPNCFYIGFTARDLSSAKGFERFIEIAKKISERRTNVRFVFCGSSKVLYSYEGVILEQHYGRGHSKTFMDYVLEQHGIDLATDKVFKHVDLADYAKFAEYVESMDLFLYPLQYGSANWGLFEILFRERCVIASDRCFIPEIIKHRENGLLCKYDDIDAWVELSCQIIDNPAAFADLSRNALTSMKQRFSIEMVAPRYKSIFEFAIANHALQLQSH